MVSLSDKPVLDIIAVTYGHNHELKCFVESILAQSVKEWRLMVVHDGPSDKFDEYMDQLEMCCDYDGRISSWSTSERHNDWGHSLRAMGISGLGDSKYTLITNADDYFAPVFVKEMCCGDEDLVYCNCSHHHWGYQAKSSMLRRKAIDISCCVVKTEIVREVGWNSTVYHADWLFLKDVMKARPDLTT
ncbi:MAG: glycosyltransferase family A protein, partial [Candidatus Neomarinimicrobiota bacterium]